MHMSTPARLFRLFCMSCLALSATPGFADENARPDWQFHDQALIERQAPEDVERLRKTLHATGPRAEQILRDLASVPDIEKLAMIRFYSGFGNEIWTLFKTDQDAVVAQLWVYDDGKVHVNDCSDVNPSDWDALFDKFFSRPQRKPAPALEGHVTQGSWPRGYSGVVDLHDGARSRAYLLATDDISHANIPSAIDDFFCRTVFSGMHCHPGIKVWYGPVQEDLQALDAKAVPGSYKTSSRFCEAVPRSNRRALRLPPKAS